MKKAIALILTLCLTLTAAACGKTEPKAKLPEDIPAVEIPAEIPGEEEAPAEQSVPEESGTAEKVPESDEKTEPAPIVMTVPTEYRQVYDRLMESRKNANRRRTADGMVFAEEETVAEAAMEAPAPMPAATNDMVMKSEAVSVDADNGGGSDYSTTNSQVAGIDEGDIVKTDGKYIYVLKNGNELVILSANGENTEVLSDTVLYDNDDSYKSEQKANGDYSYYSSYRYGTEMYINDGTLAILCSYNEWWEEYTNGSYSYDDANEARLELYDVSDPGDPELTETFGQDGWLTSSRMMGDDLYILSRYSVYVYGEYEEDDPGAYIPYLRDGEERYLMPVDRIVCPPVIDSTDYTVICRYDLSAGVREDVKTVLGAGDTVYMSPNALYLAGTRYVSEDTNVHTESVYTVTTTESMDHTEIIKLALDDGLTVTACCEFEGNLLGQFAMDEYDGTLRVVATLNKNISTVYTDEEYGFSNYKWDSERHNALYVFDSDLNLLGSVGELAEGEQVYSVRFDGDVGYFVTFRTVDPLFAVNLSDPTNPQVMSELKIPGFSRYLHPYSDTLLFGLGQNADEETGWTENMKLSMFNVSDPYNVFEQDKLTLDISYSTALYNHKAILVAPEKSLIGFPSENGYLLYGYTEDGGFALIDEVKIDDFWWNGDSRGLYAGEYFYIVTPQFTAVLDMENFDLLARVKY